MPASPKSNNSNQVCPPTFTPCSRLSNMTINSRSGNRTKIVNCRPPSFDVNQRFLEISCEKDDTPDHPNLTMVLSNHKISFDQFMDNDNEKPPLMLLSDEDESDEEIIDTSNSYSPGRMSLSPDRGFATRLMDMDEDKPTAPVLTLDKEEDSTEDRHYDPDFSFTDGIYEDNNNNNNNTSIHSTCTYESQQYDMENVAPSLWLKYYGNSSHKFSKKTIGNNNNHHHTFVSSPLQEITVDQHVPKFATDDRYERSRQHAYKKKITGDRPHRMRMMRALSPTREDMRRGKEPATTTDSSILDDPSRSFFLANQ